MSWQELKHALLELFESFSLPFDDHFDSDVEHNLQPITAQASQEEIQNRL